MKPLRRASPPARRSLAFIVALLVTGTIVPAAEAITGIVRDRQTSAPLASKIVAAYSPSGFLQASATTNSQGRYTLNLSAGSYRVLAFDQQGVYATSFAGDAESFESSPIVFADATIDFTLTRAGFIDGGVSFGGMPLVNATVEAYNLSGTRRGFALTDSSGKFHLVLPPGEYKLVAYQGTQFAPQFFNDRRSFDEADRVTVAAGQTASVGFGLDVAARFTGVVTDKANNPLAAKLVLAYTPAGSLVASATTDSAGNFSVLLAVGSYRFVAADPIHDYAPSFFDNAQSFDRSTIVVLSPSQTRSVQFALERAARVSGRVIDAATTQPLVGITVAVYNLDGTIRTAAFTDTNGNFIVTLPSGEFKIASFDQRLNYASEFYDNRRDFASAARIPVVVGATLSLPEIALDRGTQVGGTASDQISGGPVAGITVAAYDLQGNLITSATTNQLGLYTLVVVPGTYKFLAFDPQLRYAVSYPGGTSFETTPARTVNAGMFDVINFSLVPGVRVSGTVRDQTGAGLSDIDVVALDVNGNKVASARSTEGTFAFALAPGTYKFMAVDPAGRYRSVFFRGADLATAEAVTISSTNSPTISFTLIGFQRRRAVQH